MSARRSLWTSMAVRGVAQQFFYPIYDEGLYLEWLMSCIFWSYWYDRKNRVWYIVRKAWYSILNRMLHTYDREICLYGTTLTSDGGTRHSFEDSATATVLYLVNRIIFMWYLDALNRDSLDLIERCIFIVCLDQSDPIDSEEDEESVNFNKAPKRDFKSLGEQILHGGKHMLNAANRWYDKTMQFIIGTDGLFGLNYEHSPAEAIAVIQLIEHLFKYM